MTIRGSEHCKRYLRDITAIREHLQSISEKLDRLPQVSPGNELWEPTIDALDYCHIYDLEHAARQLDIVAATLDMIPHKKAKADE